MNLRTLWQGNPVRHWIVVFLLLNLSNVNGFSNPLARLATLSAMSERGTFQIDPYVADYHWTDDWARTPDGHYYSNKAPAPMLVGFPLFWVFDKLSTLGLPTPELRDQRRLRLRYVSLYLLSLSLQILPFALLLLVLGRKLEKEGLSAPAIHLVAVGMLFGNTASLFMNTFFGHGFTAALVLALSICVLDGRWLAAGLAYGFCLLSDYGCATILPAFLLALLIRAEKRGPALARVLAGGVAPGLLWIWYHASCFGSPLAIAAKYQNPVFIDAAEETHNLWGVIRFFPNPRVLGELVFGSARGLAWTQPWVVFLLGWLVWRWREVRALPRPRAAVAALTLAGLAGLVWMNSSFGGWHSGGAPGPRYLSPVLPLFALVAGYLHDRMSDAARIALWAGLAWAVALYVIAYSTFIVVPVAPLWRTYWEMLTVNPTYTPPLRIAAMALVLGWGVRKARRLQS